MRNCPLQSGRYTITASSGPVSISDQNFVVVEEQQIFDVDRQGPPEDCTYAIYPESAPGSLEQNDNWRIVAEVTANPQLWAICQYSNQANTYTITNTGMDPRLGWTDPGGRPGPNHQLYLTVLDPDNVVPQQRYIIRPIRSGMRGNVQKKN
ncbi:hypothetical protein V8B97DRAFT_2007183 [Scleroderma yunnanense]